MGPKEYDSREAERQVEDERIAKLHRVALTVDFKIFGSSVLSNLTEAFFGLSCDQAR